MSLDAVIFDFDDTLIASNCLFDQARQRLFAAMRGQKLRGEEDWARFLNHQDIAYVREAGYFSAHCFPQAMRDTYLHFAALSGREPDAALAAELAAIGWQVYEADAARIEGAEELLSSLQGRARLFLLTQGDTDYQRKRLEKSGFLPFFDDYYIVRQKDAQTFRELILAQGIDVSRSWMIGNSLRSDINPALEAGLKAAHFQISAWDYEHAEPLGGHSILHRLIDFWGLIADEDQGGGNTV